MRQLAMGSKFTVGPPMARETSLGRFAEPCPVTHPRYERASVIVTSNKPFSQWGDVFGDDTVAAAMIDRLVHHAEIVPIKGDSYRLKNRDLGRTPPAAKTE